MGQQATQLAGPETKGAGGQTWVPSAVDELAQTGDQHMAVLCPVRSPPGRTHGTHRGQHSGACEPGPPSEDPPPQLCWVVTGDTGVPSQPGAPPSVRAARHSLGPWQAETGGLAFRLLGVAPFLAGAWSGTVLGRNECGKQALGLLSGLARGAAPEIRPGPARRSPHLTRHRSTHAWRWEAWRLTPPPPPLVRGNLRLGAGTQSTQSPSMPAT